MDNKTELAIAIAQYFSHTSQSGITADNVVEVISGKFIKTVTVKDVEEFLSTLPFLTVNPTKSGYWVSDPSGKRDWSKSILG